MSTARDEWNDWPMDELAALRAEVDRLRTAMNEAARDLYSAEVHRQLVGWDQSCTERIVRTQHLLADTLLADTLPQGTQ